MKGGFSACERTSFARRKVVFCVMKGYFLENDGISNDFLSVSKPGKERGCPAHERQSPWVKGRLCGEEAYGMRTGRQDAKNV